MLISTEARTEARLATERFVASHPDTTPHTVVHVHRGNLNIAQAARTLGIPHAVTTGVDPLIPAGRVIILPDGQGHIGR